MPEIVFPGAMPREHEAEWKKAKARVREEYPDVSEGDDRFWQLVQAIYRKMTGGRVVKKSVSLVLAGRDLPEAAGPHADYFVRATMCKAVTIGSGFGNVKAGSGAKGHSMSLTLVPPAGQSASEAEDWAGQLLDRLKGEKHDGRLFIDSWIVQSSITHAQPACCSVEKPRVSIQNLDCADCRRIARKLRGDLGIENALVVKAQVKGHYRTIQRGRRVYVAPHQTKVSAQEAAEKLGSGKQHWLQAPDGLRRHAKVMEGSAVPRFAIAHVDELWRTQHGRAGSEEMDASRLASKIAEGGWKYLEPAKSPDPAEGEKGLQSLAREAAVRLIRERGAPGALAHQKARLARLKAEPTFDASKEGHRSVLEHRQAVHDLVDGHVSGRARLDEAEALAHLIQHSQRMVSHLKRLLPYSGRSPDEIEETLRPVEAALASRDAHAIVEAMEAATPKLWQAQKEMADKEKGSPR